MRAVGLKVLKNRLSEYVRLAAGGETVLVTDRDRVVAELVSPREGRSALLADAKLADAVRQGWLTPPVMPGMGPPESAPVASLARSHDEQVRGLLGRLAFLELSRPVLARALAPFAKVVRTIDALHLASMDFLRRQGQEVRLASYDERLVAAARQLKFEAVAL